MSQQKIKKQLIKTVKCQYFNQYDESGKYIGTVEKVIKVYRNEETKEKFHEIEETPKLTFYVNKEDRMVGDRDWVTKIPIEDVDEVECNSVDVIKTIYFLLEKEQEFYSLSKKVNDFEMKKANKNKLNSILLNANIHGADVDIEDFYISKHFSEFPLDKSNNYFTKGFFDIEVDSMNITGFPKPEAAECPIFLNSYFDTSTMTCYVFALEMKHNKSQQEFKKVEDKFKKRIVKKYKEQFDIDISVDIIWCKTEIGLIKKFFKLVHTLNPDFMGAWNLTNFDIKYITNRLNNLIRETYEEKILEIMYETEAPMENVVEDIAKQIVCHGDIPYKYFDLREDDRQQDPADKGSYFQACDYTNWVDMLLLFANLRKSFGKRDSYALDDIAKEEIKAEKVKFKKSTTTIKNSCYEDYEECMEYNIHDTILLYLIEKKNKDFDMLYTVAAKTETRITKALKKTVCIKNLARRFYFDKGYIMSNNHNTKFGDINAKAKKEFRGAFVGDPNLIKRVGVLMNGIRSKYLFDNVVDFDLTSLYPSIILAFNIDCTTQYGYIDLSECKWIPLDEDGNQIPTHEFVDDIITRSYIDIGSKYFNLPTIDEALDDLAELAKVA